MKFCRQILIITARLNWFSMAKFRSTLPKSLWFHFYLTGLLLFILIFPKNLFAQSNLHFERIFLEQGLSHGIVLSILQDDEGFMWFATADGLNRYDGYRFKIFKHDPDDPNSLSDNYVEKIYKDSSGSLWIGTRDGLNLFDRDTNTFKRYQHNPDDPQSLSSSYIMSIFEDRAGMLWIGTLGGGLNRFDRHTQTFTHYRYDMDNAQSLSGDIVYAIVEDHLDNLWIGTRTGGLNRFEQSRKSFKRFQHDPSNPTSLSHNQVYSLLVDSNNDLWIGTRGGGLNRFNSENESFVRYQREPDNPDSLNSNHIFTLYEDQNKQLWIGTKGGGLNLFNKAEQRFIHYKHHQGDPHSLNQNTIFSIYQNRSGILWFGAFGRGINKLNPDFENFGHYRRNPAIYSGLNDDHVLELYQDKAGILWIGTRTGGLNRFDRQSGTFSHYRHDPNDPRSISDNMIYALYQDQSDTLWIGTDQGGLNRFNTEDETFSRYLHDPQDPNSISSDEWITPIIEDSLGSLWIGTRNGLDRFDTRRGTFQRYQHDPDDPTSLSDNSVSALFKDKKGTLWVGTRGGGLNRFNEKNGSFTHYQYDPANANSLSHNAIYTINEDQAGTLWIGTFGGGLNKLDQNSGVFTHYREKEGLPNDHILSILTDDQGHLWISTYKGLSRFDPSTEIFKNYLVSDGLQSNQFSLSSAFKTPDGQLMFGGVNGFNAFYPNEIQDDLHIPAIVITDFLLFNRSVPLQHVKADSPLKKTINQTNALILSHEDLVFSFEFSALHYANPAGNQYTYKLEGFDKNWVTTSADKRFATYTNLPSGNYTFQVKGSNKDGIWNETGRAIQVTILPAPWRTWWAYTAYLLLFIVSAGILFRDRYQRIALRLATAKQIEASEERLSLALWGSRQQLWDWDIEQGLLHRHNILEELNFSKTQNWQTINDFAKDIHANDHKSYMEKLQQHLQGETEHFEAAYRLKTIHAEWIWVMDKGRVVSRAKDGKALRMSGVMLNVHELYELNENLEQLVAQRTIELQNSLDQLQQTQEQLIQSEKMAALGGLVTGIAHEMNTPLGICVTAVSLQLDSLATLNTQFKASKISAADLKKYLKQSKEQLVLLERSIQRSADLVIQFKLVAVDDTYEKTIELELAKYLPLIIDNLRAKLKNMKHTIHIDIPENIKLVTYSDAWTQIITNLIDNSIEHGFASNKEGLISIKAQKNKEMLELYYHDNGKGLSEEQLTRIYDPFYTTNRGSGGTGLGMHIVYNLITQKLGGEIECTSTLGEGVTFKIDVPMMLELEETDEHGSTSG